MSKKINLSELELEDLKQLVGDAEKEIKRKQKAMVRDVKKQMDQLAGGIDMTPEQVIAAFKKRGSRTTVSEPKFANPDNPEQTWTGHGKQPQWYKDAKAKGYTPEQMLIKKKK